NQVIERFNDLNSDELLDTITVDPFLFSELGSTIRDTLYSSSGSNVSTECRKAICTVGTVSKS
ncbi:MAG: hypothetical protein NXI00_24395, partial [Cytophagales bacterium]|nr:hypothetical protein [Cytophagales bacterium]